MENKKKIIAIVGSMRKDSYNLQMAKLAKEYVQDKVDFEILEYKDIPMFNQDIEFPAPDSVTRVRAKVEEADGVWFFSPEYNHFFSGALKNLLDWLSRPVDEKPLILSQKPAALTGTSPGMSGTVVGQNHLVTLLSFLDMRIMNTPRLIVPTIQDQLDEHGQIKLTSSKEYLERQADAFLDFINK